MYGAVSVFNLDSTNDAYVGFAAGTGKSGSAPLIVSPRAWVTIPVLTSHVSIGGSGGTAGVLLLAHLKAQPTAGGKF